MLKILLTPHPMEVLPAHFGENAVPYTMEYDAIHPDLKKTNVYSFLYSQMATGIGNFYNQDAKVCAADAIPGTNNTKFYGAATVEGFAEPIAWYAEILPDPAPGPRKLYFFDQHGEKAPEKMTTDELHIELIKQGFDPVTHFCRACQRQYTASEAAAIENSPARYLPCGHHGTAFHPISE